MAKIKQLSPQEAQKIAAGEVVERPAHICKELIENALDAQATQISLYIEDGGKKLIRMVDNGCGMDSEDAEHCFGQHATSKISTVHELETINTFGFRGEALASIAAVSRVTLITKEAATNEGTKVIVEGGKITTKTAAACTTGTDITIRNLFYNIPARQKFLKKAQTEWRHIQLLFQAFCFDYPTIHFKLFSEGKQLFNCPPTTKPAARCQQLWEHNNAQHVLPIKASRDEAAINISGFISNHQHYRYDRSGIFFFVNKRWIKNQQLNRALLKGYLNVIPEGRYPTAVITITINPTEIDINIHPRKEEVKFMHPQRVQQLLQQAVKHTLEQNLSKQIQQPATFRSTPQTVPIPKSTFNPFDANPFFAKKTYSNYQSPPADQVISAPIQQMHTSNPSVAEHQIITSQQSIQTTEKTPLINYRLIGHYKKTYLLIEKNNGLFFIDQHAAHERILYELFSSRFDNVATVTLIFPQIISLTQQDIQTIQQHLNIFHRNGIAIEPFGTNQLRVQSTPVHLKNQSLDDLVHQVIGWIKEYESLDKDQFFKTINEKMHAQMACKAAVKAGDELNHKQIEQLLRDLEKTPNRFSCPHGRPTGWSLGIEEIEKKFRRRR